MKRFCPSCGYDLFGRLSEEGTGCPECGAVWRVESLSDFSLRPWWWYWLVIPWCAAPAVTVFLAPLIDHLIPDHALTGPITFWATAASPVFLLVWCSYVLAAHRLARWYFGAFPVALVLCVLNLIGAGVAVLMREGPH